MHPRHDFADFTSFPIRIVSGTQGVIEDDDTLRAALGLHQRFHFRVVNPPDFGVVEEVSGRKVPVKESPRRPGDPPALVAASEKAQRELGWKPHYTELRPIVETAWNWHRTHLKGYDD